MARKPLNGSDQLFDLLNSIGQWSQDEQWLWASGVIFAAESMMTPATLAKFHKSQIKRIKAAIKELKEEYGVR